MPKKLPSLPKRLEAIRQREGLTEYSFAKLLRITPQQYYAMKTASKRTTRAWDIVLRGIEKYGTGFLRS